MKQLIDLIEWLDRCYGPNPVYFFDWHSKQFFPDKWSAVVYQMILDYKGEKFDPERGYHFFGTNFGIVKHHKHYQSRLEK